MAHIRLHFKAIRASLGASVAFKKWSLFLGFSILLDEILNKVPLHLTLPVEKDVKITKSSLGRFCPV